MLININIVDDIVILKYSDGEEVKVAKTDMERAWGPIVSASKEDVKREFGIQQ